jgi:hypothetical protein
MAASDRANPNRVQIGINDTPLTSAIEKGDFKTAEKLIEENEEPSYLNEGIIVVVVVVVVVVYSGKMLQKLYFFVGG